MGRVARIVVLALAVVSAGLVAQPAWAEPPLPSSMAAIGDSITRAYDVCCSYGDHPGQSWSTGSTGYDGITSHYERIRQLNPAITGRAYNNAVSGTKMSAAPTQAEKAVSQGARYVTILLGANDLSTSSPSTMTPPEDLRAQFSQAMATLMAQGRAPYLPVDAGCHQHRHPTPAGGGSGGGVQPDPGPRVRQVPRWRWDGGAVYNYQFSASQVSSLDFFHPSLSGQAALARVTWGASWWPSS